MHFTARAGVTLALTTILVSSIPITKRGTFQSTDIDTSQPFTIVAYSIPSQGTQRSWDLQFYTTHVGANGSGHSTYGLVGEEDVMENSASFILDDTQLLVSVPPACEDPNGCGSQPSAAYGNIYPTAHTQFQFQSGQLYPQDSNIYYKGAYIQAGANVGDYTFYMCPGENSYEFILNVNPEDSSSCTQVNLAPQQAAASCRRLVRRQTSSTIDPTQPFQIEAYSIPVGESNAFAEYTLTSFYSSVDTPNQLGLQAASQYDKIANFTLYQSQLILYASPICEDPNGGCATSEGFGDLYPNDGDELTFQAGPYSPKIGGFTINNDNEIVVPEDTNAVQFSMCPKGKQNILIYEATGSDCTPVKLVAQQ